MAVIFTLSTDFGSSRNTGRIITIVLRWFKPAVTEAELRTVQAIVRKSAHLTAYAVLAVLCWRALQHLKGRWHSWVWTEFWLITGICLLYAISDEVHQSFVPSRQGQWQDVLIDTGGAIAGLLVVRGWQRRSLIARETPDPART
jgi:VanZ family protein